MSEPIMADLEVKPQSGEAVEYPYGPRSPLFTGTEIPVWQSVLTPKRGMATVQREPEFEETLIVAVGFVFTFATANFALVPLIEALDGPDWGAIPVFVLFGAVIAQVGLLSAMLVFCEGSFWLRSILCWGAGAVLWSCWAAGILTLALFDISIWRREWPEVLRFIGLSLPLLAMAIHAPLWFARCYLGWRLTRSNSGRQARRPLSIGDYLIGTAAIAFAITCARLAPQPTWDTSGYWPAWAVVIASAAVASLLTVVPAMLIMFRASHWPLGLSLLVLYGFVAGLATLGTLLAIFGRGGAPASLLVAALVFFISSAAFLGGAMKVVRDAGFELVLGQSRQT